MGNSKQLFEAYLDSFQLITILLPKDYYNGYSSTFYLEDEKIKQELLLTKTTILHSFIKYECAVTMEISPRKKLYVSDERGNKVQLFIGAIIRTKQFDERYYYGGDDLGISFSHEQSKFRIWAPIATAVSVVLFGNEKEEIERVKMIEDVNGTWVAYIEGDYEYFMYQYAVTVNGVENMVIDPYAHSSSPNSEYSYIIDRKKVKEIELKPIYDQHFHATDAIIYETHIRDFTIHPSSGVSSNYKGTYKGFTEEHTHTEKGNVTCLSYVKTLGVTHIELMPINDFAGVDDNSPFTLYNWGYNPLSYFALEGSYSTIVEHPYERIFEMKNLIKKYHESGLGIILDVVYNHVYELEESNLHKIVPGYYFRYDLHGMPSNGTGVGNDIASERKMVKKLILDSIKYFVEEFGVDGFRFDLMGILTKECMEEIHEYCESTGYKILLFGEGWKLPTAYSDDKIAIIEHANDLPYLGYFNDVFREAVRGNIFDLNQKGYAFGNFHYKQRLEEVISGSISINQHLGYLFNSPVQSVNYVECHDNSTMWDHLLVANSNESDELRKKRQFLATSFVILSQGMAFLHSGQEFFRTKDGNPNSYKSPDDINALRWSDMDKEIEYVEATRNLIDLRKKHRAFRFATLEQVQKHVDFLDYGDVIVYMLKNVENYGPASNILIIWNATLEEKTIKLPISQVPWYISYDEKFYGFLKAKVEPNEQTVIKPLSIRILFS